LDAQPEIDVNKEIVPLLEPIPAPLSDKNQLSEDPVIIRAEISRLLAADNYDEALPMIDVLLILDDKDLEMLETRGRILLEQGFIEDGTVDLSRCCREGRRSCCR
jgi:hypothetical protein